MNLSDFRDLVKSWTDVQGEAYVTEDGPVTDVINRTLKIFAGATQCLQADDITGTLTASTAVYSLQDTATFSRLIHTPFEVWVSDERLTQIKSYPDLPRIFPNYETLDDAPPTYWVTRPTHHVRLVAAPDSAYTIRVSASYLPAALEEDDDTVDIPDEAIDAAAIACAIAICSPRASGSLIERIQFLKGLNDGESGNVATLRKAADRLREPLPCRRSSSGVYRLA